MREVIYNVHGIDYFVREDGKIFSTKNTGAAKYHQEIKQRLNADGYPTITCGLTNHRKAARVHRIVAMAFIPNPNPEILTEVDHIDCDRENNHVSNLRWISSYDNKSRVPRELRSEVTKGSKNGRATFTEDQIIEMRRLYDSKEMTIAEIAKKFNSYWSTINNIVKRLTWTHV